MAVAPAPAIESAPTLTLPEAQSLLARIFRDDDSFAPELFLLLRGLVDPNGNSDRFAVADEVMQDVIVKTPQFEEWYRQKLIA